MYPGQGFDFDTQSHLIQTSGFPSLCANWDYSPSRELTAMFYPCFEYSLLVYLILDFWATALAKQRGEIPNWFWRLSQAFFPITVFLCAQFRMIFVAIAYIDVKQHTAGFWGLQLALIMVAIHNCLFILVSGISYNWLGGRQGTKYACIAYLVCDILISCFKVAANTHIVRFGFSAQWTQTQLWEGTVAGQVVDSLWMLFNGIIPAILSFLRSRSETSLEIIIGQDRRLRNVPEPDYAIQANLWSQKEEEDQFKMNTISRVVELRKEGVPDSQIVEWFPEAEPFISNMATDGEEAVAPENPVGENPTRKGKRKSGIDAWGMTMAADA